MIIPHPKWYKDKTEKQREYRRRRKIRELEQRRKEYEEIKAKYSEQLGIKPKTEKEIVLENINKFLREQNNATSKDIPLSSLMSEEQFKEWMDKHIHTTDDLYRHGSDMTLEQFIICMNSFEYYTNDNCFYWQCVCSALNNILRKKCEYCNRDRPTSEERKLNYIIEEYPYIKARGWI